MKKLLLIILVFIFYSCDDSLKTENKKLKEEISLLKLRKIDSLSIYNSYQNNIKLQEAEKFVDSIDQFDKEKYDMIKKIINNDDDWGR